MIEVDIGRPPESARISSTIDLSRVTESFSFSCATFIPATLNRSAALKAGPAAIRMPPIIPSAGTSELPPFALGDCCSPATSLLLVALLEVRTLFAVGLAERARLASPSLFGAAWAISQSYQE